MNKIVTNKHLVLPVEPKTRAQQYARVNTMFINLEMFAASRGILLRDGEGQRPAWVAAVYADPKLQRIINEYLGINYLPCIKRGSKDSMHIKSLARDKWIVIGKDGKDIAWCDHRDSTAYSSSVLSEANRQYHMLGEFWESMGGTWGGRFKKYDPYHFQPTGRPL